MEVPEYGVRQKKKQRFKVVFVVYIEGAFVGVMNEQFNYIIVDKLQLTQCWPPIVAVIWSSGLLTFVINATGARLNMARILLLYSGRSAHST